MEGQKTGKPPKLVMAGKRNKTPETRDTQIPGTGHVHKYQPPIGTFEKSPKSFFLNKILLI